MRLLKDMERYWYYLTPEEKKLFRESVEGEEYQAVMNLCKKKEIEAVKAFTTRVVTRIATQVPAVVPPAPIVQPVTIKPAVRKKRKRK